MEYFTRLRNSTPSFHEWLRVQGIIDRLWTAYGFKPLPEAVRETADGLIFENVRKNKGCSQIEIDKS
jgi:hypothetical protein